MNQHILNTLASLHSHLTLLENQIHLAGRDANDIEYKMESLKTLITTILHRRLELQRQGMPTHHIHMHGPYAIRKSFQELFWKL